MVRIKNGPINCKELMETIGKCQLFGDPDREVTHVAPMLQADLNDLAFCNLEGEEATSLIMRSRAGILFVNESIPNLDNLETSTCLIATKNPRLSFIRCLNSFFPSEIEWGKHDSSIVHEGAILPKHISIGPYAVIGKGVRLGEGSIIGPRVIVLENTVVGKEVLIQAGAIIGCEGQGFERNDSGIFEKFPQIGRVILKDGVEIGANSTIVRGALTETIIDEGSKIGHLSDIGHNVQIGKNCFISACVLVGGSAIVKDSAWLAPNCTIRPKVVIGERATIGLGAVVIRDVDDGSTVGGVPAVPLK